MAFFICHLFSFYEQLKFRVQLLSTKKRSKFLSEFSIFANMLYLYEPKLIMSLWQVCVHVLASAGLSEPPLVDGHGTSNTILCTGSIIM